LNFKARSLVAKESSSGSWDDLSPKTKTMLKAMMEGVVRTMLFVEAAPITSKTAGNSGFDVWFESRGPRDERARSLRELDLTTRLFKPHGWSVISQAPPNPPASRGGIRRIAFVLIPYLVRVAGGVAASIYQLLRLLEANSVILRDIP
jgi:hypothetical protein